MSILPPKQDAPKPDPGYKHIYLFKTETGFQLNEDPCADYESLKPTTAALNSFSANKR